MLRVATFAQEMTDAGVRIVFYSTGEEMVLDNETSRLLAVMRGFASESERRKIASRTRESAERKARRWLVAGGIVFGYRNVPSPDGAGEGLRTICKSLSERGISSPRASKRGIGAWVSSAVHAMLRRPLYIGRMEWGHVHKTYKSGTRVRTNDHRHDVVVVDAPHLRIVPDQLWNAVQARIRAQEAPEKKGGRPATYLLSGGVETVARVERVAGARVRSVHARRAQVTRRASVGLRSSRPRCFDVFRWLGRAVPKQFDRRE